MIRRRRRHVSLLAFLWGVLLLFVVSTAATETSVTETSEEPEGDEPNMDAESDNDAEIDDNDDDDKHQYDPHIAVLIWLKNRAEFAEEHNFMRPWKHYIEEEDDKYQYQNGYFFANKSLRVLTEYSSNDKLNDGNASDDLKLPRIVATENIQKGELLISVPSDSFVYQQDHPTYKMLHPCDVTSALLNARTYRYPTKEEQEGKPLPSFEDFVRPFLDSLLKLTTIPEHELLGIGNRTDAADRHLWSVEQLESLQSILGNELSPKANILALWGDAEDENDDQKLPMLCQHPNPHDLENNRITDHFFNPDNPRAKDFQRLFRATVAIVVTRSWNNRMVPLYHWISRSDEPNVIHSESKIDSMLFKPKFRDWEYEESGDAPSRYQLHAARDIVKGEELILPYHSVAQKFATTGSIGRHDETEETKYRFWTQTLHDQWGVDFMYAKDKEDPYEDYLSWDYYPESQTIEWVHKHEDISEEQALRATQRNVLQAQYLRLRSMEEEVKGLLKADPNNAGNLAIVEYYELWVESLGLLLANVRPNRKPVPKAIAKEQCLASQSCAENAVTTPASYDDLRERVDGDPINYNGFVASHECTNKFSQSMYEENKTPYAQLEWSRSYIGGGSISDHDGDEEEQEADEREQDTCLHLENVLHSCLSFRPHVHETLIHYPASFLPKDGMKRVLYVGGGDLVLLHELMRYKSVELVIGMDIDQTVLRNSFRHYGIQPKFEDERVHWWFGDAAKSLTLLPPEEYFGTFDMVLIDLVVEIFDGLRVGQHNERLVDYMAKLLKPEGILVRQEDWPLHNVVDFAKYTVDLNVFGMPHTCSQYFTMASNTIDFANHERVDHELEDLVWYEPNVGSHDHTKMWAEYRNNLDPPERICKESANASTHVLPSNGLFVAIEAEDVTLNLAEIEMLQVVVTTALLEIGFSSIERHDITLKQPDDFSSMLFTFEEGYLAIRSFPKDKFASLDFQLWNDVAEHESAVRVLVKAIGGERQSESTSTFYVTTGGMFGTSNMDDHSTPIVLSKWCDEDSTDDNATANDAESLSGLKVASEKILTNFIGTKDGYVALVLCPDVSSPCKALDDIDFGSDTHVVSFRSCSSINDGSQSSLKECETAMRITINEALSGTTKKIRAIVIDSEANRRLGQITNQLFVSGPMSYHWLSHDFVVLAPSSSKLAAGYSSSWRYQLLERFRTDMVEFNPVYHSTISLRDGSSTEWVMNVLSVGNPLFYGNLIDSMDAIRGNSDTKFEEVILVETKTGAIPHIPDYQPSKWATPSDYDIEPAQVQYSEQAPVGVQLLVQHEKDPEVEYDIKAGDKVLFFIEEDDNWCTGFVVAVKKNEFEEEYAVRSSAGHRRTVDASDILPFDFDDETPKNNPIPFGAHVLADGLEEDVDERYFHPAQVMGEHKDGRLKVYYLNDGSFGYVKPNQITMLPFGVFSSPEDAKLFASCDEFYEMLKDKKSDTTFKRRIGDGCLLAVSWPQEDGDITTFIATYDGQIHMDFNVYSSADVFEENYKASLVSIMADEEFDGTDKKQTDFHPRGHGRVVNFRHDLKSRPYFGTKYPMIIQEV